MKKTLNTILIVITVLLAFTACSPQDSSEELVSATLTSSDRTRALIADVNFDITQVATWKYTATKADNGLATGATAAEKELTALGQTELLSQGSWNFSLYGYNSSNKLICSGTITNATVTVQKHTVSITVTPMKTTDGKGTIAISEDFNIIGADGTVYSSSTNEYTLGYKVYKNADNTEVTLTDRKAEVTSGLYKAVITFTGTAKDGTKYTAAEGEKVVNVYDNLTTTVRGTIEETAQVADINRKYISTATKTVEDSTSSFGLSMEVSTTPSGEDNKTTTVVFPSSSLTLDETNTDKTVKLTVKTTPVETASSTYKVVSEETTAVAGFDLTLEGATIAEDNTGITITTTIAKGLDKLSIKYVADSNDNTAKIDSYKADTGELKFTVKHFSEYCILTSEIIAHDEATLNSAIANATTEADETKEIKLVGDIALSSEINITNGKNVKINLNGHKISNEVTTRVIYIENGHAEFTGEGVIQASLTEGVWSSAINLRGSKDNVENYSTVKIDSSVTLKAFNGILLSYNKTKGSDDQYHSYGVVVTMKGKYIPTKKSTQYCDAAVNVNGTIIGSADTNVPIINISGATLEEGSLYIAGYAKVNIENTTITSSRVSPVEIRAGELNIASGTLKCSVTPSETKANGNGSTTTGAAIAVVQHNTKQPISVKISGGTFEAYHAMAVMNPQKNSLADLQTVKVEVTGGSFSSIGKTSDGKTVDIVNVDTEYFTISENPVYSPNASFTVTPKPVETD